MSIIRQDPTTKEWVIVATDRALRPDAHNGRRVDMTSLRFGTGVAWIGIAAIVIAGCASASSRVPVSAVRGQSEAQITQDTTQCQASAASSARTDRERDSAFAACMIASGYRASVAARVGADHGRLDVQTSGAPSSAQVLNDLRACQGEAPGLRARQADVVAGRIGSVFGGDQTQVRPHDARSEALERGLAACLARRGYTAAPSALR
jgi:hypothetical protein